MKRSWSLCLSLLFAICGGAQTRNADLRNATSTVGQSVFDFVQQHMGRKVGAGECWDLAAEALNSAGATWDGRYGWGLVIDPLKDPVLPGDVVQFENVVFEWEEGNSINRINMSHHTAVVTEVLGAGRYLIAHQNFGEAGRKVGTTELNLSHRKKGSITFHRPQR